MKTIAAAGIRSLHYGRDDNTIVTMGSFVKAKDVIGMRNRDDKLAMYFFPKPLTMFLTNSDISIT